MRIKLLGRRRQWFLEKGESLCKREQRANSFALCREQPNLREAKDCLSERSERVPQPQKPSASAAVKKAPMRRVLWYFLSAQKVRNPSVTLYDKNYLQTSKINRTPI
jgi:hypothetical protein